MTSQNADSTCRVEQDVEVIKESCKDLFQELREEAWDGEMGITFDFPRPYSPENFDSLRADLEMILNRLKAAIQAAKDRDIEEIDAM